MRTTVVKIRKGSGRIYRVQYKTKIDLNQQKIFENLEQSDYVELNIVLPELCLNVQVRFYLFQLWLKKPILSLISYLAFSFSRKTKRYTVLMKRKI